MPRPAGRIIALYGAFNEILDGMGRAELIVARTDADRSPERIAKLPVIGTHMRPNIEAVLAQKPDLVLQMAGRKEASLPVEALKKRGVPVAVFRAESFAELFSVIRRVGILTATPERAEAMARFFLVSAEALPYDEKAVSAQLTPESKALLTELLPIYEAADDYGDHKALEAATQAFLDARELKFKAVAQPLRVALTGKTASPGLFETMSVLGKAEALKRIRRALAL